MENTFLNLKQFQEMQNEQDLSVLESAGNIISKVNELEKKIHAFGHLEPEEITERAKVIDSSKKEGLLLGIPIAIKDNICIKDGLTTCASKILSGFRPPYSATVIDKLTNEGALLLGGANMDEFAFGSSCETSCYGPTRNPWDLNRIPGGSSGGSVSAVSSGEVVAALGSDTGGSIRQPASLCGVVGMKPTYGRVSRYGLLAFASSLDQIGPITRNIADCARILEVISGHDEKDSTSVNEKVPVFSDFLDQDIKGLKIGIPHEYFQDGIDPVVKNRVWEAVSLLKKSGAQIIDISLPHTKYAVSAYYIIGPAEASSNLARYDGVHYGFRSKNFNDLIDMYIQTRTEGFGEEAKRRILLGTYSLSSGYYDAYYLKAQKVRTLISQDFHKAFEKCDCIATPTSPTTAFKIGERTEDPLQMYLSDVFTIPANLAGLPAVSIPCGLDDKNLPIGLQLMAPMFREDLLIKTASCFEKISEHCNLTPELS